MPWQLQAGGDRSIIQAEQALVSEECKHCRPIQYLSILIIKGQPESQTRSGPMAQVAQNNLLASERRIGVGVPSRWCERKLSPHKSKIQLT